MKSAIRLVCLHYTAQVVEPGHKLLCGAVFKCDWRALTDRVLSGEVLHYGPTGPPPAGRALLAVIAVPVMVMVMVMVTVKITVSVVVPAVVMFKPAAISVPVTVKEPLSIMMR